MNQSTFKNCYQMARMGALGPLCFAAGNHYQWFLRQVYDLRFPHIGDDRHQMQGRSFDAMRYGGQTHARLAQYHQERGWLNCRHKPLIRLWVEYVAISRAEKEAA